MKRINEYVNSVYKHVGGNQKEVNELKEEMKSHLIEIVYELQQEGMSESEAVDMAIKRFGEQNEVEQALLEVFKKEKIFAKWLLNLGIVVLILGSLMYVVSHVSFISRENALIMFDIRALIERSDTLTDEIKLEIEELVSNSKNITEFNIYDVKDLDASSDYWQMINAGELDSVFHYQKSLSFPNWIESNYFSAGGLDSSWYIFYNYLDFDNFNLIILVATLSIYATLFTIWAVINAYHQKRLNIGWVIIFAVFNIVGYWIYRLCGKMKR